MVKITLIAVGKLKERSFIELENEFLKRLHPYAKIRLVELGDIPYRREHDAETARKKEAENIKKRLPAGAVIVALDEAGKPFTSASFASYIGQFEASGRDIAFLIGSSSGLDAMLKESADLLLSLSAMTFTHNFARVLLIEQIYRALTIRAGKAYHK